MCKQKTAYESKYGLVGSEMFIRDCDEAGQCIHLGHAIMDLRYHEGGP